MGDQELKQAIRIPNHPVDLREFTELMNRYNQDSTKDPEEPYRRAFASINQDGSGQVSAQELRAAIQKFLGPNVLSEVTPQTNITIDWNPKIVVVKIGGGSQLPDDLVQRFVIVIVVFSHLWFFCFRLM